VVRARRWTGNAAAQFNLGLMYAEGRSSARPRSRSRVLSNGCRSKVSTAAQLNLGVCYERGLGVLRGLEAAANWYRLAAPPMRRFRRTVQLARMESQQEGEAERKAGSVAPAPAVVDAAPAIREDEIPPIGERAAAGSAAVGVAAEPVRDPVESRGREGVGEIVTQVNALVGRVDKTVGAPTAENLAKAEAPSDPVQPARQPVEFVDTNDESPNQTTLAWRNRGFLPRGGDTPADESAAP
jgi:hypothetical protein